MFDTAAMPEHIRFPLLIRSLLVGFGAFSVVLVFFLVLPYFFSISMDIENAVLYAAFAGAFFGIASWLGDRDEEL